ncbi:MAG TPA: triacylglycerol lipase [Acidimicrobiales bacterium]|jgi:triacylglycerol lipase|nr:triacylglycerol lipase [Acidimicrobiales bacterium]
MRKPIGGLLAALTMLLLLAPAAPPARALAHDPILFVHGWNSNSSTWTTMINRFTADGWTAAELNNWSYDYSQSNATTAQQLSDKVNAILAATGAAKVDIISHSMGGLSSRYYTKNLGGGAKVDDWVSLGGPNHGTDTANFCFSTACTEMRINSAFLNALNTGDETPGAPHYGTYWSACDSVINPDSSVSLVGATNTNTACISHSALHEDAAVYALVREFVR